MSKHIKAGRVFVSRAQLESYATEEEAIEVFSNNGIPKSEIIRVWKEVKGKTSPTKKNLDAEKPKEEKEK